MSARLRPLSSGLLDHLDEHFPCLLRGCYRTEKVDTGTFDSFLCLQSKREAQTVDGSHACLGCLHLRMGPSQQDHRLDVIGVHVSEDARRGFGQRVWCSMFVVSSLDPSHHAKAPHIVEVDGLEPEKAEVGEVYPVTVVFMASKVLFSNRSSIMLWHRFGMADQGGPCGSERVAIGPCLSDEEAASRI